MKLNKGFEFKIETTRQGNLLKKFGCELDSTETRISFYGGMFAIKKNVNITLIFLSKQKNGYIAYISNYFYGLGEFMFYTHSEVQKIAETWGLKQSKEPVLFNQWRLLCYKDSVINEFIDPLVRAESEYMKSKSEYESSLRELEYKKDIAEKLKDKFEKNKERFNTKK